MTASYDVYFLLRRLSNFRSKKHKRLKDWLDNVSEPRDELAPEVSSAKIKFKMLPSELVCCWLCL